MIIAGEWASCINCITHLNGMAFDVNVSLSSFEINHNKLTFLIKHEMFRLNIPIQIPAVVDKLHDFYDVDQYILVGEPHDATFILLHYQDIHLICPIVEDPINAGPLGFGYVLP